MKNLGLGTVNAREIAMETWIATGRRLTENATTECASTTTTTAAITTVTVETATAAVAAAASAVTIVTAIGTDTTTTHDDMVTTLRAMAGAREKAGTACVKTLLPHGDLLKWRDLPAFCLWRFSSKQW